MELQNGRRDTNEKQRKNRPEIMFQDTLLPERHINGIFSSTFSLLANIMVVFTYLDKEMQEKLTSTMYSKLEYAAVIWSPHK